MIFVTVGMHSTGFDRLVRAMDAVAAAIDEPVMMQIGASLYEPQHATWFRFAPYEEIQRYCREARLVVCQAATSILTALEQDAAVVAVPRQQRYGEVIDDHQVEFAQALAGLTGMRAVVDVHDLQEYVLDTSNHAKVQTGVYKHQLAQAIQAYIAELAV